jgi:polyhydroxyalkanoate synthesis regulator protein
MSQQQIPNVMGGYLEKGAKAVIDMQEELRSQALKLFSGFPYAPGTPPAPGEEPKAKPKAAPKTAGAKKGRKAK